MCQRAGARQSSSHASSEAAIALPIDTDRSYDNHADGNLVFANGGGGGASGGDESYYKIDRNGGRVSPDGTGGDAHRAPGSGGNVSRAAWPDLDGWATQGRRTEEQWKREIGRVTLPQWRLLTGRGEADTELDAFPGRDEDPG